MAYADDLTPIADNIEELEKIIQEISIYLNYFKMKLNASKTEILTNLTESEIENRNLSININGHNVNNIKSGDKLSRILGVFFTLDGKTSKTIEHASKQYKGLISLLYSHYSPGPIAQMCLQSVIFPILGYRLQNTPIQKTKFDQFDITSRKLIKTKYYLSKSTPNYILYDKEMGINLQHFQTRQVGMQITNMLIHVRNNDVTNQISHYIVTHFTKYLKLKESILVCPISDRKIRYYPYIQYISNKCFENKIQLRKTTDNLSDRILTMLSTEDYNKFKKIIYKRKLFDIKDIIQTKYIKNEPIQYICYSKSLSKFTNHQKIQDKVMNTDSIPEYFASIIKKYFETFQNIKIAQECFKYQDIHFEIQNTHKSIIFKPAIHPKNHKYYQNYGYRSDINYNNLKKYVIYTDGSHTRDPITFGSAAIITRPELEKLNQAPVTEIKTFKSNYPIGSSTTAEIDGIYSAITSVPNSSDVIIKLDSTSAIKSTRKFSVKLSERQKLKINNHYQLRINSYHLEQFRIPPKFEWVKAHTNNHTIDSYYNNLADKHANLSREAKTSNRLPLLPFEIANSNPETYLHENNQIIQMYPAARLKFRFRSTQRNQLIESLDKHNDEYTRTNSNLSKINIKQTLNICTTRKQKQAYLNASDIRELKFRINLLIRKTPTKDIMFKQKAPDIIDDLCPRCNIKTETIEHLLSCKTTTNEYTKLIKHTKEITNNQYQKHPQKLQIQENISQIFKKLQFNKFHFKSFTNSSLAFGRITNEHTNLLSYCNSLEPKINYLQTILDAWLTTFYKLIWVERCHILYDIPPQRTKKRIPVNTTPFSKYYTAFLLSYPDISPQNPRPPWEINKLKVIRGII
jgi:ribonuclease HI